jgi:sarcosine oxidase subunit gamma
MSEPVFASPLAAVKMPAPDSLSVALVELVDIGMIDLRGNAGDPAFEGAIRKTLGLDLPTIPRSSTSRDQVTLLWLSPDQWLALVPRSEAPAMTSALKRELAGLHAMVCDVSDMRTIIRLAGPDVRQVLIKGTAIDVFSPEFAEGFIRRLSFAELAALVHVRSTEPWIVDLYVARSFAGYVWNWLVATASTGASLNLFGQQEPPPV